MNDPDKKLPVINVGISQGSMRQVGSSYAWSPDGCVLWGSVVYQDINGGVFTDNVMVSYDDVATAEAAKFAMEVVMRERAEMLHEFPVEPDFPF